MVFETSEPPLRRVAAALPVVCNGTRTLNKPTATFVRLGMLLDPSSASASTLMLLYSIVTSGRLTPAA